MVSFGCGHDAYLSDEIVRLMKEISGKTPLILKLDESDVQGLSLIHISILNGRYQCVAFAYLLITPIF